MEQQTYTITFDDVSNADANRYANELRNVLLDATPDVEVDFYLAIRRTRADNPRASGIEMTSLAYTLREKARYLRRIVILDCCFAGAAFSAFQAAGPAQVAIVKTVDAFEVQGKGVGLPERGTSLLCSSRHTAPSLISQDGTHTIFSQTLLRALSKGDPRRQDPLSLRAITDLTEDILATLPEKSVPRPEIHNLFCRLMIEKV